MKVLHVNEQLSQKGGVESYLRSLLPLMDGRGIDQYVAFGKGSPEGVKNAEQLASVIETGFSNDQRGYQGMSNLLSKIRPHVVHIHNVRNLGVLKACWETGKAVATTHDYRLVCPASMYYYKRTKSPCTRSSGPGCFRTTVQKHCLTPRINHAAYFYHRTRWFKRKGKKRIHLIAPSQGAKNVLQAQGIAGENIAVIPYFCPVKPLIVPRPLPLRPTITFMGRLAPNKGYEYFLESLGQLPREVRGVMVGSFTDQTEEKVMQLATLAGVQDRLELHRWATREEVVRLFDETTVFVFPSLWHETLGIVGLEAMARGVPVVASDLGGVREWLKDGENGYLVQPKSSQQIANAVIKLISNKEKLISFGKAGLNRINKKFLASQHIEKLLKVYDNIAYDH